MRIGHGYDVHALVAGRPLVLGAVMIPYPKGLDGHSDADVLLHALCDALLGAAGFGDLGMHFPDTDVQYKGCASSILLKKVSEKLKNHGYTIVNIDSTIVLQLPKLQTYIPEMRKSIADLCGIETSQINIKATTEEHLGFTGDGSGIAAHAVCLIKKEMHGTF